jgi:tetratricopeptide (TPR) repeat protein
MYQDRYEEALQALDKSIEQNPNNTEVWRNKGVALYFLGRYEEAIWATEKAIEVDPRNTNAVNQRDQFVQEQGN